MPRPPMLVEKPSELAVSLEEAQVYPGLEDADGAAIKRQIAVSTEKLDGYRGQLGRAIIHQTWRQDFDCLGRGMLRLRFPDVIEDRATAVWRDRDGAEVAAPIVLDRDAISFFVRPVGSSYGQGRVLRVDYVCGFGATPDDVPAPIREAILIDVAHRVRTGGAEGQLRSFQVDGAFTEGFNSPEQASIGAQRMIADLLRPYRWVNVP